MLFLEMHAAKGFLINYIKVNKQHNIKIVVHLDHTISDQPTAAREFRLFSMCFIYGKTALPLFSIHLAYNSPNFPLILPTGS